MARTWPETTAQMTVCRPPISMGIALIGSCFMALSAEPRRGDSRRCASAAADPGSRTGGAHRPGFRSV